MNTIARVIIATAVVCCWLPGQSWIESNAGAWRTLQTELRSADWRVRHSAFEELIKLGEPSSPAVRAEIFALLDRENEYLETLLARGGEPQEAWSQGYLSPLQLQVLRLFDEEPTRERFRIAAASSYGETSVYAMVISRLAGEELAWLAQRLQHANRYQVIKAMSMAANWLAYHAAKAPEEKRRMALAIVAGGLNHRDYEVRGGSLTLLVQLVETPEAKGIVEAERIRRASDPAKRKEIEEMMQRSTNDFSFRRPWPKEYRPPDE